MTNYLFIDILCNLLYMVSGFFFGMTLNELRKPKIIKMYNYFYDNGKVKRVLK